MKAVHTFLASGFLVAAAVTTVGAAESAPKYQITKTVALGAPDRWDYVVFDAPLHRVYISHGDRVSVVDGESGDVIGTIEASGSTHGIASVHSVGKGYTDDGKAGVAIVFDLKTLKVLGRIKAEPDADGIVYDEASGHVLVIDGDSGKVTVIDPQTDKVVGTIDGGGELEFGAVDGHGKFYVDGAEKNEIVRMDLASYKADAHWPLKGCTKPHGLALDQKSMRLFASCANGAMAVVDAKTGAPINTLPIGQGTDFAVFDPVRGIAYSSNRDGTLSPISERGPGEYVALPPIATAIGARTMALNPATGRIYMVTADMTPNPGAADPHDRFTTKPGTVKLLFLDPSTQ